MNKNNLLVVYQYLSVIIDYKINYIKLIILLIAIKYNINNELKNNLSTSQVKLYIKPFEFILKVGNLLSLYLILHYNLARTTPSC